MEITKRISRQIKNPKQMSKQTAVEWLEDMIAKMEAYGGDLPPLMIHIKKAKETEKQQIIDAYVIGAKNQIYGVDLSGLEYYNKTFNK